MVQGRYPGQGPNFLPPNGRSMRYPPPNFQGGMSGPNPSFQQMPPQPGMRQPRKNRSFNPQGNFQQPPKKEGLLGKLLGKNKQKAAPKNLFAPPSQGKQETRSSSSGGIMGTLRNPEGITNMLTNTQKVLQAVEQFTPMVQQYSPMVKNLPSIWKVMRAFGSNDNNKTEETKQEETPATETINETSKAENADSSTTEQPIQKRTTKKTKPKKKAQSGPKLYI